MFGKEKKKKRKEKNKNEDEEVCDLFKCGERYLGLGFKLVISSFFFNGHTKLSFEARDRVRGVMLRLDMFEHYHYYYYYYYYY